MSRIEEAMNKARQLREAKGSSTPPPERVEQAAPAPRPIPAVTVEIANPLLVTASNINVPVAEEYRKLKSMVLHITKKKGFQNTLMVTSSVSGEGKSLTALNLAVSMAQEHDHSVLLVDADMRNPSLCRHLGVESAAGLADCLSDGMDIGEALIRTGLGNLAFLPAGRRVANPVELFSSQKMKDLLHQIKHRYADRYVVFDSPPLLPFAEARLLGSMVDGVVFVVREGGPSMQKVSEALDSLKDGNVLGVVFNAASEASIDGGYYSYYHSYRDEPVSPPRSEAGKPGLLSRILKTKGRAVER